MSEGSGYTQALERALAERTGMTARDRQVFSTAFVVGWDARVVSADAVMVTREYLADLERRVSIREGRAFLPDRPEGSVS